MSIQMQSFMRDKLLSTKHSKQSLKLTKNFLRKAIICSIDPEWIAKLKSKTMGFNHRSPLELLTHLRTNGGDLNHLD
ncbi:LOW QUALITY PROTEIN: hypothetical protein ACHAW6_000163, partial [Cyclotella cf. meneghiniana]